MFTYRLLIWDGAPDDLLDGEIERARAAGCEVTLNLHRSGVTPAPRDGLRVVREPIFDLGRLVETVREGAIGYDAVKSRANVPLPAGFFDAACAPGLRRPLRVVGQIGSGIGHIDTKSAQRYGVRLVHTPGTNAVGVAEFVLGQILAVLRGLVPHDRASHAGIWRGHPPGRARELGELTLGLAGYGHTGAALARRAAALGMRVLVWRAHGTGTVGAREVPALHDLLPETDVLSVHARHTPGGPALIGRPELALLRPGAVVVNAARGGLVDEQALADALRDPGHPVAGAAVDVFEREHDRFSSPLVGVPGALLTPHVAGLTGPATQAAARECVDRIVAALAGPQCSSA
ncbi:NAD(P)-dependent oxidoreductase [Dactylosporangium sp. NPDC051485]|uniref:NAD(P)-dependent oxidoreductase n=1 Tax=Dactylosporangium sp. NPDC051485 TaxID=3154846 RepID=UPI00343BAAFC